MLTPFEGHKGWLLGIAFVNRFEADFAEMGSESDESNGVPNELREAANNLSRLVNDVAFNGGVLSHWGEATDKGARARRAAVRIILRAASELSAALDAETPEEALASGAASAEATEEPMPRAEEVKARLLELLDVVKEGAPLGRLATATNMIARAAFGEEGNEDSMGNPFEEDGQDSDDIKAAFACIEIVRIACSELEIMAKGYARAQQRWHAKESDGFKILAGGEA